MIEAILTEHNIDKKNLKNKLFLSHWCNYDNSIPSKLILKYHWKDQKKYTRDYKYLNSLHKKLTIYLSNYLNSINNKKYSVRYWSIIINPWLIGFISNSFDKWCALKNLPKKKISSQIL